MAAVHLFLYIKVAPGKHFYLGSNSFNSDTNAAAAAELLLLHVFMTEFLGELRAPRRST